jgi:FSR family fosmidomycin resistance protein-like MFS transporter
MTQTGTARHDRLAALRLGLFSTVLVDELLSGFLFVALPLIRRDLGLSYAQAGLLLAVGKTTSMLFEPALYLWSDRRSKRLLVVGGLVCLALGFGLAATARQFAQLLLAFALVFPAGSAAVGLAQATLIDLAPEEAPRTMTRWTLAGAVGDLLSPLLVAAWTAAAFGWRSLFGLSAALWLGTAAALWPQRYPRPEHRATGEAEPVAGIPWRELRVALANARLRRWIAVLVMTGMVDEILLAFAGLFLTDVVRAPVTAVSLALGAEVAGALLGLCLLDRLLHHREAERLLPPMAVATLAGLLLFLRARSIVTAGAALFLVGLGAAGWYPIAEAAAYATFPGRSGLVRAASGLAGPVDAALPALVGAVASRFGVTAGIGLLVMAPVGVLLLAPRPQPRKS